MIDKLIKDICEDVANGAVEELDLKRMLSINQTLYPQLLLVESRMLKDVEGLKTQLKKTKDEYERYNMTQAAVFAENGILKVQEKLLQMESLIIALNSLLGGETAYLMNDRDTPVLSFEICPTSKFLEVAIEASNSNKG